EAKAALQQLQATAIVVAGPNVRGEQVDELSENGVFPVVFDSQAAVATSRGLLINPLLGPSAESYLVEPGTQMLLGPRMLWCGHSFDVCDRCALRNRRRHIEELLHSGTMIFVARLCFACVRYWEFPRWRS